MLSRASVFSISTSVIVLVSCGEIAETSLEEEKHSLIGSLDFDTPFNWQRIVDGKVCFYLPSDWTPITGQDGYYIDSCTDEPFCQNIGFSEAKLISGEIRDYYTQIEKEILSDENLTLHQLSTKKEGRIVDYLVSVNGFEPQLFGRAIAIKSELGYYNIQYTGVAKDSVKAIAFLDTLINSVELID